MSFIQKLKLRNANVRGSDSNKVGRVQRQTLQDARDATIKKLEANKAYFLDNGLPRPDLCYKQLAAGYSLGIKYGNRYLDGVFDQHAGGFKFLEGLRDEDMPLCFDHAIQIIRTGECDRALQQAMAANIAIHAKPVPVAVVVKAV